MQLSRRFLLYLCATAATTRHSLAASSHPTAIHSDFFGTPGLNQTFDYVVVGGGTAGLAIATRLAEDKNVSVAVVEAGGFYETDNGNKSVIPAYAGYYVGTAPFIKNGLIDWNQQTQPMQGLGGRDIYYASGKTFGGGSARNFLVYNRAPVGAYQKWADEVGDQSYTFDSFLPYLKKSISFQPVPNSERPANASYSPPTAPYDPNGGPIAVSSAKWINSIGSWAALGLKELGLAQTADFVSGTLMGYQYCASLLEKDEQIRSSSQVGFLNLAVNTDLNILFFKSTLAKQIIFDGTKATGVRVDTAGQQSHLMARKEVILSAGSLRSPQLLMVSGIGPRSTLEAFGIPVIHDLPGVGQNFQDQPFFDITFAVDLLTHSALAYNPSFDASQVAAYNSNKTGMLTNIGDDFIAYEKIPKSLRSTLSNYTRTSLASLPNDWPDMEWVISDAWSGNLKDFVFGAPVTGKNYVASALVMLSPFSRGNVTISSTDTATNPIVNPNYLADVRDQEQAIAIFKRGRQLMNTKAMAPILRGPEAYPGSNITTDAQILASIQQTLSPIWHAAGTCKMGKECDQMAVVDSHARVFGVQGLRVVDASIFPFLPPIHPTATIYGLAEKIADDIKRGV